MRVCVDGRSLVGGPGRGVGQSTAALVQALRRGFPSLVLDVVVPGGRRRSQLRFGAAAVGGRPRLGVGADVVLLPAPAPVAVGAPSVLWVHDRSWELRPQDFTPYERLWHRLARPRVLARSAARVVVTTAVLRDDLVATWALDPARVSVAAPGVRSLGPPGARGLGGHLLFVGALEPRKGPDVLERALALARARGLRAPLVAVGEGRLGLAGAWHRGRVDDLALAALLDGALALVVPSRLEGFGLPAVEALARGCPVVCSDLPEVREALGEHATYVPPGDAEALADALLAVEAAPPSVAPDAVAGLTWDATAWAVHAALVAAAAAGAA